MIIGNNCDQSGQQVVTKERGQLLADGLDIELFIEINAKDSIYVEEVANCIICLIILFCNDNKIEIYIL